MKLRERLVYLKLIFLIGLISAYDTALIVIYGPTIFDMESNPCGNWLLDTGGIPLFAAVKSTLTILVVILCVLLVKTKYRVTILGVLSFQFILFLYLTFYTSVGGFDGGDPIMDVARFYFYGISE